MSIHRVWQAFPVLCLACALANAADSKVASVKVRILGLKSTAGSVNIAVFERAQGFPGSPGQALQRLAQPITQAGELVATLQLAPGTYSFAVFHDEDGDQQLKKNFLGMPVEGVGFSRNPKIRMRAPAFDECTVAVADGSDITITVDR